MSQTANFNQILIWTKFWFFWQLKTFQSFAVFEFVASTDLHSEPIRIWIELMYQDITNKRCLLWSGKVNQKIACLLNLFKKSAIALTQRMKWVRDLCIHTIANANWIQLKNWGFRIKKKPRNSQAKSEWTMRMRSASTKRTALELSLCALITILIAICNSKICPYYSRQFNICV